jgi:hypothetical protein
MTRHKHLNACLKCPSRDRGNAICIPSGRKFLEHCAEDSCPEKRFVQLGVAAPKKFSVASITPHMRVCEVKDRIHCDAHNMHEGPSGWEHWANVQRAHREELQGYLPRISPAPAPDGSRGIVICTGGKFFASAYVTLRVLRHVGCQLPAQLWYLGRNGEREPWMDRACEGLNVSWSDGDQVAKRHPCRILNGWELKSFALLHAAFDQVLMLDSDSYPVRNPEYLFEDPGFETTGAMFFPDDPQEDLHRWTSSRGLPDPRTVFGLTPLHEPAFESGQFLVDRIRCWDEIHIAWWLNNHSDFVYKLMYGDKDTFHLAWRFVSSDYAMPEQRWTRNNPPGDNRTGWAHTMQQHDMQGQPIFYHRVGAKFQLGRDGFMTAQRWENVRNPALEHEDFCWQALEDLRAIKAAAI